MVAARCGARLFLSDSSEKPSCLQNCRRSGEANGLSGVSVLGLSWGEVPPDLLLLPELDVVLGSDVFYDPEGGSTPPQQQLSKESSPGLRF